MITLEVQSKKLSKSVSIFPDDTLEVVRERIGAEFNISPSSMLLIVKSKQRITDKVRVC
jgi:folate-dependent phosphoribosylglycinamide formyltransferase PurN